MLTRFARPSLLALALVAFGAAPWSAAHVMAPSTASAKTKAGLKGRRKIRSLLRRKGLATLPSVSQALAGGTPAAGHLAADVVGTPPALVTIPDLSVADLFWAPGVLDAIVGGSPSPSDCGQFWAGTQDGESGGMGACHMAENVGYTFGDILSGETSLCYMKAFPTPANIASGAVTLVDGSFPGHDPTRLFSVPGGSQSRVVKVDVTGDQDGAQTVFIRVYSTGENRAAGDLYAADLWFCPQGQSDPRGFNSVRIGSDGQFSYEDDGTEPMGSHADAVTGFVSFSDGQIAYDTTRSRQAQGSWAGTGGSSKSDHEIDPDDTMASKARNDYGGNVDKSYTVSSFSGSDADGLRFLAGAFKEVDSTGGGVPFVGAAEFRSTYYAAAPGSALVSRLSAVDLASDDFYAAPASVTVDVSSFSCTAAADVEVALDFTNAEAQAVKQTCEHQLWQHMQFCENDPTVQAASTAFQSACMPPH
jgi:hypothetical protein